jgi:hypothetical protein
MVRKTKIRIIIIARNNWSAKSKVLLHECPK